MPDYKRLIIPALTLASFLLPGQVDAVELAITENGSGSSSEVAVETQQQTTVTQTNQTTVQNDVDVDSDTGNNTADGNSGDTTIETGNTDTQVNIDNQVNHSDIDSTCCQQSLDTDLTISGNGSDSDNQVDVNLTNRTTVDITQNATITNNINISSNTGYNTIKDSQGKAVIETGDINVDQDLHNQANTADIEVNCCQTGSLTAKIKGNGSDSNNQITYENVNDIYIQKIENAFIFNDIDFNLTTGFNSIGGNSGDAYIKTGDITISANIDNHVNDNIIKINPKDEAEDMDDEDKDDQVPPVTPPPVINGKVDDKGNGNGKNGNGDDDEDDNGNGEILGIGGGDILPVTGSSLLFLLIANILMFLLGSYLRLLSGRSPALAYTKSTKN